MSFSTWKGIVLAGGSGTRLHPLTLAVSKQLMPVYDKPLVYYPLSVLLLAGIRDVCIISTPRDLPLFRQLLGDGSALGCRFVYREQAQPEGIAQALLLAADFIAGHNVCLILGDNIFFGQGLGRALAGATARERGATVFGYHVRDPERYGVVTFDRRGKALAIEEKPAKPESSYAVTGLYFYDPRAPELAAGLRPSARGELEITDLNRAYLEAGELHVHVLGRGVAWLDTGTHDSLLEAGSFVHAVESRQDLKIACIEEIAWRRGFIDDAQLEKLAAPLSRTGYGQYMLSLLRRNMFEQA
ncbi:MAG: glucose-1-phosphate thymidylyltransferase RfbA [Desulfovibrio sp.]|jgi:glucose-1-phosphate thymidylyltransferase|nr:glucose-1-phosphate thymidylyltransferase RfbA [Desulfovibrio sp.]